MKKILFVLIAAIEKYANKTSRCFYQFYNIQLLKWKGAKVGSRCVMSGKTAIMIASGATLEIGDNFICRSEFHNHILGDECSSINIYSGGGKDWA